MPINAITTMPINAKLIKWRKRAMDHLVLCVTPPIGHFVLCVRVGVGVGAGVEVGGDGQERLITDRCGMHS